MIKVTAVIEGQPAELWLTYVPFAWGVNGERRGDHWDLFVEMHCPECDARGRDRKRELIELARYYDDVRREWWNHCGHKFTCDGQDVECLAKLCVSPKVDDPPVNESPPPLPRGGLMGYLSRALGLSREGGSAE